MDLHEPPPTLYCQPNSVTFAPPSTAAEDTVLLEPWLLSENDLPFLTFLFKKKYPSHFDPIGAEGWFRNIVLKSPLMFYPVRLANSFLIAMISCVPWLPADFDCHIVAVCADDGAMWETLKLLRSSIDWARKRQCKRWMLASDTVYDLGPMARRLDVKELSPRFTLELTRAT